MTLGIAIVLALFRPLSQAEESRPRDRYFLSGDGWVRLANAKTKASARIRYRLPDGSYPPDARRQINRLFGVPAHSGDAISLRLVSLLDYVEDRFDQPIRLLSGYRSPQYNQNLRNRGRLAAKASLHIEGMAADIRIPKATAAKVFEIIKALQCCGVGYYHGDSLHLDTGPARYWDETSSKVDTDISSHNKRIMVYTDQDIYLPGETVTLKLARVTDYPVGLVTNIAALRDGHVLQEFPLDGKSGTCVSVPTPQERAVRFTLPEQFRPEGNVQFQVRFCEKPFPEMPDAVESNPIRIWGKSGERVEGR